MKAYKGFNNDMTCRGFQYEVGKTYEMPEGKEAKLCEQGFHACENPVMCLSHYIASKSVYHEVDIEDVSPETESDTKRVARKISIGARLDVAKICKLSFDYVKEHCTNENNVKKGNAASAGSHGAASAGESGAAVSRGSASSEKNGLSVARGNDVKVKGGLGALLVIAEEFSDSYDIKDWKAVIVDGETVKADTWYCLKDGKLTECE